MSKLTAIHKQIAALQAEAERITKREMSAAIDKVKGLMSEFGLTIEHLTQAVVGKPTAKGTKAAKAAKVAKAKSASVAKYVDPKSGKTWSGFGRAPAWIAGAKDRAEFLIGAVKVAAKPASVKKSATKAAAAAKRRVKAKTTAAAKPAIKKTSAPKAAAKKKPATKASAVKKAATKKVVKARAVAKKAAPRKTPASVSTLVPAESAPTAA